MIRVWWLAARPKTLPASVSPILLGSALAFYYGEFRFEIFLLAMLCAMALQVAVNFANDWADAESGVDTAQRLGPARVMQSGMASKQQMLVALVVVSLIAFVSGLVLVMLSHWSLLVFGLLSLLAVFAYSSGPFSIASNGLGEVMVFLFFGLLAVAGTFFAHALTVNWSVFVYASVAGLISAAIMLVNNLRDIPTDAPAGKNTLAVRLGESKTRLLYRVMLVSALAIHLLASIWLSPWALVPAILIAPMIRQRLADSQRLQGTELNGLLANTAKLELMYCVFTSVLFVGLAL